MKRVPRAFRSLERLTVVHAIRDGLVNMIPILIIGAFALILTTFPSEVWQRFLLNTAAGGFLLRILELVYAATFGVLSLYMTLSISRSYMKLKSDPGAVTRGAQLVSILCFFILAGAYLPDFGTDEMGPKSMFLAILTSLGASALYLKLSRLSQRRQRYLYSAGADRVFNRMLSTILPITLTALAFALLNALVMRLFDVESFRMLLSHAFNALFSHLAPGFFRGFFFVLLSSLLWFFGIHGSDTLEGVMQSFFAPGLAENQAAVASGALPTAVLTKEFFDCFVLMGGCGSTICLLIAILLFSRSSARRGLGLTAAFPMIFNINEMMVFGLPIIFNPIMLIPFLVVPLLCYSTAYFAVSAGLVPMIVSEVAWTTPVLLGGFRATGSLAGSALQLTNIVLGMLIYLPFVRLLDRQSEDTVHQDYEDFLSFFRAREQELAAVRLIDQNDAYGEFAKMLCAELRHHLKKYLTLAYQPQYRYDGACFGVEALMRWRHPTFGLLYPPLVIKLADEGGFLPELEEAVLSLALEERKAVLQRFGDDIHISVNVTGTTIVTPRFRQFCRQLDASESFRDLEFCLEVTEQAALSFNEETLSALREIRDMGLSLEIDDFSMGQTSVNYLKDGLFSTIKLDGSLVKGLDNPNCREIVSSIASLSASLGMEVLAEYVETEEQREILHRCGCDCYQGWLYSPAVFLEEKEK